jgi:hypothetical protein
MSAKKEALQALSIPQNVVWNPFTFRAKGIDESVDRGGDTLVNQTSSIRRSVLLPTKMLESTASAANRSFFEDGMFSIFSLAPLGHSSVTPLRVWNISAGFRSLPHCPLPALH